MKLPKIDQRLGPLPVWAWGAIAIGAVVVARGRAGSAEVQVEAATEGPFLGVSGALSDGRASRDDQRAGTLPDAPGSVGGGFGTSSLTGGAPVLGSDLAASDAGSAAGAAAAGRSSSPQQQAIHLVSTINAGGGLPVGK